MSPLRVSGVSSQYLATDVEYLHRISCLRSIHGDFTLEMAIRGIILLQMLMDVGIEDHKLNYTKIFTSESVSPVGTKALPFSVNLDPILVEQAMLSNITTLPGCLLTYH